MDAICVDDLHKRFGRGRRAVDALRGVSLRVAPGEIYGLLGRNGAGKTTLVKILLDIVRGSRGEASVLGRSSRSTAARRPVGYLPEDHRFPGYLTGEGALRFYGALSDVGGARLRRRLGELLELVDLRAAARRKIRSYSKGMKQRLGLAQALIHDPEILFLDEPTDGVDPVGRAAIRDILIRLKAEGTTIFLNSHLLSETERLCDRVGILHDGRLVREGTIGDLTEARLVFRLRTDPPVDDRLLEAIGRLTRTVVRAPKGIEVQVEREEEIDAVIDLVRHSGLGLRALEEKRVSLEDAFLGIVGTQGGGVS